MSRIPSSLSEGIHKIHPRGGVQVSVQHGVTNVPNICTFPRGRQLCQNEKSSFTLTLPQ
jgi:hypothetical protein